MSTRGEILLGALEYVYVKQRLVNEVMWPWQAAYSPQNLFLNCFLDEGFQCHGDRGIISNSTIGNYL